MFYALCLAHWQGTESETLKIWRTSNMNVIRVTKTARNRVDVVFTGDKYLFFNPDNGLIALAQRHELGSGLFHVQRTEQISKKLIEETITDNEPSSIVVLGFEYHEEHNKPQHTLPYVVSVKLEKR